MMANVSYVKLGDSDVADIILGQSPSSSVYNKEKAGLPFYQGKADFGFIHPTPSVWCDKGKKFAKVGDVLMSVRAPVGDVNIANEDCAIGRGITAIRALKKMDRQFLYFALLHSKPALEVQATGTIFSSVNKDTLLNLDIPIFGIQEQRAIAKIMLRLCDAMLANNSLISTMIELKEATLQNLFSNGLRGEKQKETEIGQIPSNWGVAEIGDLFEIVQGLSLKKTLSNNQEGIPFLRTSNVYWGQTETSSLSKMLVSEGEIGDRWLKSGDLLVCEGGDIGRAAVWDGSIERVTYQNHLHRLRPKNADEIIPKYAQSWLEVGFLLRTVYEGAGNKTTIPNLSRGRLSALKMPLADIEEQREIVSIIDAVEKKVAFHKQKLIVLDELFKALLHDLMTGEIRVSDIDLSSLGEATTEAKS